MDENKLIREAVARGAAGAAVICGSQVVLSDSFRKICESNQCGSYGRCWMCPPCIGPIDALMARVRSYSRALVYQTVSPIADSYDVEGMFEAAAGHARVSLQVAQGVGKLLKPGFLHLSCGGCHLCRTCAKCSNEPCRFPEQALSSLEGYGVDVYQTVRSTPLKYVNGQNTVTYFGMIFFSE